MRISAWEKQAKELVVKLVNLKDEAGRKQLWQTMHALDTAVKVVGYEIADEIEKYKSLVEQVDGRKRKKATAKSAGTTKKKSSTSRGV